jgi:hypothetical protein
MAAEGVDDEEEIGVYMQEFRSEAQKLDLSNVNEYLQSETFLESFEVREGYVYRKKSD